MDRREIIQSMCAQYGQELETAFYNAVQNFYDIHRGELLIISPRTKASLINDYIYYNLELSLKDKRGFYFFKHRKARFIAYNSQVLIRIKKFSGQNHRPAVNLTHFSQKFNTQEDLGLFKERALNVYLGYVINTVSGAIDTVAFKCPNKKGIIEWSIDVNAKSIQERLLFPETLSPEKKGQRIVAKNSAIRKASFNE